MTNRRSILKTGLALPAATLAGPWSAPVLGQAAAGRLDLERFVYDVRFAEAYDVAQHAGALGVPLSPVADDLMSLWYDELDLLWKESPAALAGITMAEAVFVLETLAMDRGMRLVFRGHHGLVKNGQIAHRLAGPAESLDHFAATESSGSWEAELAAVTNALPLGRPEPATVEFVTQSAGLSIRDVPLVSWVIAPRSALALTLPA